MAIPDSVTAIGYGAFYLCDALTDVYYGGTETQWATLQSNIGSSNDPLLNAAIHYNSSGAAESDTLSGTCGDNLTWTLVNGTLTISGTGDMAYYSTSTPAPWYDSRESVEKVVMERGATAVGSNAFYGCGNLTSVTIPDGVTAVGSNAFYGCSKLTNVTIPDGVTAIASGAFNLCSNLTGIAIPDSVTTIGASAFNACSSLTGLTIPDGVTVINNFTFSHCSALTDVTISKNVASIGTDAFSYCSGLKNVTIPDSVTAIGNGAFSYCSGLASVTIPVSVASIGSSAFSACNALTDVYYGGSETQWATLKSNIGSSNDPLLNATIHYNSSGSGAADSDILAQGECGANLTYVLTRDGTLTISGTGDMRNARTADGVVWKDYSSSISSVVFNGEITTIGGYAFSGSKISSINIPESVTSIGAGAFNYCVNLKNVEIPNGVTGIYSETFLGCSNLESVTIPASVNSVSFWAFGGCTSLKDVYYGGTRAQWSAVTIDEDNTLGNGNAALRSATIHCTDGDIIGGSGAAETYVVTFNGNGGTPETLTQSVASGGTATAPANPARDGYEFLGWFTDAAATAVFAFATPITANLTLYAGWRQLAPVADCTVTFDGNGGLPQTSAYVVEYNATVSPPTTAPTRDGYQFTGWYTDTAATTPFAFTTPITANLTLYAGWSAVNSDILAQGECGANGANVTYVLTRDGTLTISGSGAMKDYAYSDAAINSPWFDYNEKITAIVIENGVTSIGNYAFMYCFEVTSVSISDSVASIGEQAFFNCGNLESVTIPKSVASIGKGAFDACDALRGIEVASENAQYVSDGGILFSKDKSVLVCYPPAKNGTSYVIPASVTVIGAWAFDGCRNLLSVVIPSGVTVIDEGAFCACRELTSIDIPSSVTEVEASVFQLCSRLTSVNVDGENAVYSSKDGIVFSKDGSHLVCYPPGRTETAYAVSSGVTTIDHLAFIGSKLTRVDIPASVTSILRSAFSNCSALADVYYGGTEAQWNSITIDNSENSNDPLLKATIHYNSGGASVNTYTVSYYRTETEETPYQTFTVNAGAAHTLISGSGVIASYGVGGADRTFLAWDIDGTRRNPGEEITVNANVKIVAVIRYRHWVAIYLNDDGSELDRKEWWSLSSSPTSHVTDKIPVKAEDGAYVYTFQRWDDGTTETVTDTNNPYQEIVTYTTTYHPIFDAAPKADGILSQGTCGANLTYVLKIDGTLTVSGSGAMADYSASAPAPWRANRQNVRTVVLESGVSSVGAYAFDDCYNLSALTIPASVAAVAPRAFNGCAALETVSYDGTQEQWDDIIFNVVDNDALEFATVTCEREQDPNKKTYNAFRTLQFFGENGRMEKAEEQTWRLPTPLSRFRNLFIDVEDAENAPEGAALVRKDSKDDLSGADGSKEYAATSGSTVLTIPEETFKTFAEGSHNITATFQDSRQGTRTASEVYTIFPSGPIDIDTSELTPDTVQDKSYTGRLQTTPKLSDNFYWFELTGAKLIGESGEQELSFTLQTGDEQTKNETADKMWKIELEEEKQDFFFHPNGRFSGVPHTLGTYQLTVELKVRKELNEDWDTPEKSNVSSCELTFEVKGKTADNISTESVGDNGYQVIQGPPAALEEGNTSFQIIIGKDDPEDRLVAVYLDKEPLVENRDYTVSERDIRTPRLLEGGILTQLAINVIKTDISLGLHSVNIELEHKDMRGNTQTKNVARPVNVTPRRAVTSVNSVSGGSSGGSGRSTTPAVTTYTVKASKPSHGKITLSASKASAGKSVTITVTPDSGYRTAGVSVKDSLKKAVKTSQNGNQYTFTMPSRNVTVSASFTLNVYSLTTAKAEHGKVTLNRDSASKGTVINGSATPDKGYLLLSVAARDAGGKAVKVETFDNGAFTFLMPEGRVTVSAAFTVKRLAAFADIQGPDWFFDDAEWAYNRGILLGTTEQYWEPQSLMSSVTSIVTLERLDGVDLTPYDTGADDGLDNSAWYVAALRWANANRITLSDRPFGGRDAIKRGEFAVMLNNYLRYRGINPEAPADLAFTDADALTEEELHAFRILQAADVFRGYIDGSVRPETYLNRAQLAALLHRLSEYIIKAETG